MTDCLYLPLSLPLAPIQANRAMTTIKPRCFGFGSPRAVCVFTSATLRPKSWSTLVRSRQLWTKPMNEIFGSAIVLPMGVLQHDAYQRTMPFSLRRTAERCSSPFEKVKRD